MFLILSQKRGLRIERFCFIYSLRQMPPLCFIPLILPSHHITYAIQAFIKILAQQYAKLLHDWYRTPHVQSPHAILVWYYCRYNIAHWREKFLCTFWGGVSLDEHYRPPHTERDTTKDITVMHYRFSFAFIIVTMIYIEHQIFDEDIFLISTDGFLAVVDRGYYVIWHTYYGWYFHRLDISATPDSQARASVN